MVFILPEMEQDYGIYWGSAQYMYLFNWTKCCETRLIQKSKYNSQTRVVYAMRSNGPHLQVPPVLEPGFTDAPLLRYYLYLFCPRDGYYDVT